MRRGDEPATKRYCANRAASALEIRGKGVLESHWSAWFEGLQISSDEPGQIVIAGPVIDQVALHGLLAKIRDLALPLISVRRIDPDR